MDALSDKCTFEINFISLTHKSRLTKVDLKMHNRFKNKQSKHTAKTVTLASKLCIYQGNIEKCT